MGTRSPHRLGPSGFSIVEQGPRSLLVLAKAGSLRFAVLVAHSPTAKDTLANRRAWWRKLSTTLRRAPPSCMPIVLIDANANLAVSPPRTEDTNEAFFEAFLAEHQLGHTGHRDQHGQIFTSWRSPAGHESCIDYLCVPQDMLGGMRTEGPLQHFSGLVEHDHRPISARCVWSSQASTAPAKVPRPDLTVLSHASGKALLRHLFMSMPQIPWEIDVDEHLDMIHTHLRTGLQMHCPPRPSRARCPITTEKTWMHIRHRRDMRRELFAAKQQHKASILQCIFDAWRGRPTRRHTQEHLFQLDIGDLAMQIRALGGLIRRSAKQDSAEASRRIFHEARFQGPETLHRLLRQVTKSGRRYRKRRLSAMTGARLSQTLCSSLVCILLSPSEQPM